MWTLPPTSSITCHSPREDAGNVRLAPSGRSPSTHASKAPSPSVIPLANGWVPSAGHSCQSDARAGEVTGTGPPGSSPSSALAQV